MFYTSLGIELYYCFGCNNASGAVHCAYIRRKLGEVCVCGMRLVKHNAFISVLVIIRDSSPLASAFCIIIAIYQIIFIIILIFNKYVREYFIPENIINPNIIKSSNIGASSVRKAPQLFSFLTEQGYTGRYAIALRTNIYTYGRHIAERTLHHIFTKWKYIIRSSISPELYHYLLTGKHRSSAGILAHLKICNPLTLGS